MHHLDLFEAFNFSALQSRPTDLVRSSIHADNDFLKVLHQCQNSPASKLELLQEDPRQSLFTETLTKG